MRTRINAHRTAQLHFMHTPKGSYDETRHSKKGSEKVLGKGVLRRVLKRGLAVGFTVEKWF